MTVVLVVSPHPDDEALGCGGSLHAHTVAGDEVHVVFLTSGEAGGHGTPPAATGWMREREALAAANVLGTRQPVFLRQPDGDLRCTRPLLDSLGELIARLRPAVLYVPHEQDDHPDHRVAHESVRSVLRTRVPPQERPEVRCFEVWTPLQPIRCVVDISDHMEAKVAAVRAHESQCRAMRFDDAVIGLARYRGEMHSWPGGPYAEVFSGMDL